MALIGIGLPVYNGENYLRDALDSILAQTFGDFEVLIADNASQDSSHDIAEEYCRRDSRIRYHRHPENIGASGNFNFAFHQTQGKYFRWAAHDDMMAPEYLEKCAAALEAASNDAVLAYPQTLLIDAAGNPMSKYVAATRKGGAAPSDRLRNLIGRGDHAQSLIHMCFPVFGLMKRSVMEKTSLIANTPRSDTLLLVEMALMGHFVEVDDVLFLRRCHDEGSVISAEKVAKGPELERLLAAWFDPTRKGKFPATTIKLGMGYLRAAATKPKSLSQRFKSTMIVLGWMSRRKGQIVREILTLLHEKIWR